MRLSLRVIQFVTLSISSDTRMFLFPPQEIAVLGKPSALSSHLEGNR